LVYNALIYIEGVVHTMMPIIVKNDSYHFFIKFSMLKPR